MSEHLVDVISSRPTGAKELAGLFIGREIGRGMSRVVYEFVQDSTCVVKYEPEGNRFQNVLEWETWQTVKETEFAKYFAPCLDISANGQFLIQKKAQKCPVENYPKMIPQFFADLKYDNFGLLNGKFVCVDYGTAHIRAFYFALKDKKVKASFWSDKK